MLQNEGVAVETATTAEDGVRRLGQKGFDVVFLDLNLPGNPALVGVNVFFAYLVLDPTAPCIIRRASSGLTATIQ